MNELPTSVSAQTMATVSKLTKGRLRVLANLGVVQRSERGSYAFLPSIQGLLGYYRKGGDTDGTLDPQYEKAKLDYLRGEKLKDEIKTRRGELVESAEVEEVFANMVKVVVHTFETLPDRLERDTGLSPEQMQMVIDSFDAARDRLHAEMKKAAKG